jgi:simple sugar transport system substrate-binding protein
VAKLGVKKAVCLNHEVGNSSLDDRCAGFAKGLGVDVPVLNGVMDPTEMKNRTVGYLNANPGTEFMLACGIGAAEPALMALDELGLVGKTKLGTFDLSPTILQATVDGKVEWAIDAQQYAMGYVPVVMFDLWAKYKISPIADYPTGPGFVTKDTAASVIDLAKQGKR